MLGSRPITGTVSSVLTADGYLWNIWPGRHWPLSDREEVKFLASLRSAATSTPHRNVCRDDVTLLMSVLRDGLSLTDLQHWAPGVSPDLLLATYEMLEKMRKRSVDNFKQLIASEKLSLAEVSRLAPEAAKLMPVPSYRLVQAAKDGDPIEFHAVVAKIRLRVEAVTKEARLIEQRLALAKPGRDTWAVMKGRELYDPYEGGVWSLPFFLPERIGVLTPERVASLLARRVKRGATR